jgi:hypothetical protein
MSAVRGSNCFSTHVGRAAYVVGHTESTQYCIARLHTKQKRYDEA